MAAQTSPSPASGACTGGRDRQQASSEESCCEEGERTWHDSSADTIVGRIKPGLCSSVLDLPGSEHQHLMSITSKQLPLSM